MIRGLTKPAVKRLAHRAGAARLSGSVYEEIRGVLERHLKKLLAVAMTYALHAKRTTVADRDVRDTLVYFNRPNAHAPLQVKRRDTGNALVTMKSCTNYLTARSARHTALRESQKEAGRLPDDKVHRTPRPGSLAKRQVAFYQKEKQRGCYAVAHTAFARIVREYTEEGSETSELRYTSGALHLLHLDAEVYLEHLLADALQVANYAGRTVIQAKDIQFALKGVPAK